MQTCAEWSGIREGSATDLKSSGAGSWPNLALTYLTATLCTTASIGRQFVFHQRTTLMPESCITSDLCTISTTTYWIPTADYRRSATNNINACAGSTPLAYQGLTSQINTTHFQQVLCDEGHDVTELNVNLT